MANVPVIPQCHKVCIICEGFEEKLYIDRLLELSVWNDAYSFTAINAKGAGNVFACYQDAYNNDNYEVVIIFCDTDKKPFREYSLIKEKVNKFHALNDAANKVIIYANPCSMQIILSHFAEVSLHTQGKKTNASTILEHTGIANYSAEQDQIKQICDRIFRRTYPIMMERIRQINLGDEVPASTNFAEYAEKFENDDTCWIKKINDYLLNIDE